jgi:hypothetical protein
MNCYRIILKNDLKIFIKFVILMLIGFSLSN